MHTIKTGDRYVRMTDGSVIEIIETDQHTARVATVTVSGALTRYRSLHVAPHLKSGAYNLRGDVHKTGYVNIRDLPEDHPFAPLPERRDSAVSFHEQEPDFSQMNEAALVQWAHDREKLAADLADQAERAKSELKRRATGPGTRIIGDTAVITAPNERFDAKLAEKVLDRQSLEAISVRKPDGAKARDRFGKDSPLYRSMVRSFGWKMTLRQATSEDRIKAGLD